MSITDLFQFLVSVSNVLLILLIYFQIRHLHMPVIYTLIKERNNTTKKIHVITYKDQYLIVGNSSKKNVAYNVEILLRYVDRKTREEILETYELSFLNPGEYIRFPVPLSRIYEKHSKEMKILKKNDVEVKVPLKDLEYLLEITVSCSMWKNRLFRYLDKMEWRDTYHIEIAGYERLEPMNDKIVLLNYPFVVISNKRGEEYVYKDYG